MVRITPPEGRLNFDAKKEVIEVSEKGQPVSRKIKALTWQNPYGELETWVFLKKPVRAGGFGRFYVALYNIDEPVGVKEVRIAAPDGALKKFFTSNKWNDKTPQLPEQKITRIKDFEQEVRLMQMFDPESVRAWGYQGKHAYIVMPLRYGDGWKYRSGYKGAKLGNHGLAPTQVPRDYDLVRTLMRDVLQFSSVMKEQGFIHCDMKPDNFLFDSMTGRVHLSDFGLSAANRGPGYHRGTYQFWSFEQRVAYYTDDRKFRLTDKSDVQSLALAIVAMLSKERFQLLRTPSREPCYAQFLDAYRAYYTSYKGWAASPARLAGIPHAPPNAGHSPTRWFLWAERKAHALHDGVGALVWRMLDPDPHSRPSAAELLQDPLMRTETSSDHKMWNLVQKMPRYGDRIDGYFQFLRQEVARQNGITGSVVTAAHQSRTQSLRQ